MKQSIVALIRPKLNLAQKEDQAAHLIEHILAEPKRLKSLGITDDFYAQNIIVHGGSINDYFATEYGIVRSEVADQIAEMISNHRNELHIERSDFENVRSVIIEEIKDDEGEFIDLGKQISNVIYEPGSPSSRNPRNNLESILNLSYDKAIDIFNKYNSDHSLLKLAFDDYRIDKIPSIERNVLRQDIRLVELAHPWQSPDSIETFIVVPIPKSTDLLINLLYSRSLTDDYFGIVYNEIRHNNGLVYDISLGMDYNINTLEIYFTSSKEGAGKVVDLIKKSLGNYDSFIEKNLEYIKGRIKFELALDWGDIQNQSFTMINRVVSGGFAETPESMIKRVETVTAADLCKFNRLYLDSLNQKSLIIKRRHAKSPATEIVE
ncbi:MAG: hypothetical protein Q8P30_03635 [Candidatus Uhrbacteria bacterium]|nr:hypothetical protein [Candidatus Uhrbacteria bacterium]